MKYALLILLTLFSFNSFAQVDSTTPPYLRFPTLPPLQLLLSDSTTKYTKDDIPKKKPVLVMLFSPDCSHCQHTAEELLAQKEQLKDIYIVMSTTHSITQMNDFVEKYKLNEIPNLIAGRDIYYLMPSFYSIRSLPYMAFYDKKGKLIRGFEGSMPLVRALNVFKEKN